jgi:hypothetical protein
MGQVDCPLLLALRALPSAGRNGSPIDQVMGGLCQYMRRTNLSAAPYLNSSWGDPLVMFTLRHHVDRAIRPPAGTNPAWAGVRVWPRAQRAWLPRERRSRTRLCALPTRDAATATPARAGCFPRSRRCANHAALASLCAETSLLTFHLPPKGILPNASN